MIWINIWIQEFFRNFSKLQNRSLSAICALGEVRTLLDYYFLIWPDLHENFTRDVSLDKDTYSPLNFGNHPDLDPDSGIFNGILFTVLDPRRTLRQWVIFIARRVTSCTARYCFAISVCQSVECWYYELSCFLDSRSVKLFQHLVGSVVTNTPTTAVNQYHIYFTITRKVQVHRTGYSI